MGLLGWDAQSAVISVVANDGSGAVRGVVPISAGIPAVSSGSRTAHVDPILPARLKDTDLIPSVIRSSR